MQFVGIMVKYILNAISMFGNVDSRLSVVVEGRFWDSLWSTYDVTILP